jgi:hypothetical protein
VALRRSKRVRARGDCGKGEGGGCQAAETLSHSKTARDRGHSASGGGGGGNVVSALRRSMRARARGNSKWRCKRLSKEHTEEVVSWNMRGYNQYMVSQVRRGGASSPVTESRETR